MPAEIVSPKTLLSLPSEIITNELVRVLLDSSHSKSLRLNHPDVSEPIFRSRISNDSHHACVSPNLSSLVLFSSTCRRLRELSLPLLFHTLCLTTEERARRFGEIFGDHMKMLQWVRYLEVGGPGSWDSMSSREGLTGILWSTRGFNSYVDEVHHGCAGKVCLRVLEDSGMARSLFTEFSNVVELRISMGGLQSCVCGGDQNDGAHASGFRAAFVGSGLRLDQLKRLKLDLNHTEFGKSPQLNKMLDVIWHIVDPGVSPQLCELEIFNAACSYPEFWSKLTEKALLPNAHKLARAAMTLSFGSTLVLDSDELRHAVAAFAAYLCHEHSALVDLRLSTSMITWGDRLQDISRCIALALARRATGPLGAPIRAIALPGWRLGDACVKSLASLTYTHLETLHLPRNAITDIGIMDLAATLPRSLKHIDLQSNGWTDTGAAALALALTKCDKLESASLGHNPLTYIGLLALVRELVSLPRLSEIDLSFDILDRFDRRDSVMDDGDAVGKDLYAEMARCLVEGTAARSLRLINLNNIHVTDGGAKQIACALREGKWPRLERLYMRAFYESHEGRVGLGAAAELARESSPQLLCDIP
ncbi:hypothetical protein BJ742DRAFT_827890 [Cladochytrium replicatum]|nr:hypothetical protein BJ742DRAFT_827890 [Cladochytrium replicatum]